MAWLWVISGVMPSTLCLQVVLESTKLSLWLDWVISGVMSCTLCLQGVLESTKLSLWLDSGWSVVWCPLLCACRGCWNPPNFPYGLTLGDQWCDVLYFVPAGGVGIHQTFPMAWLWVISGVMPSTLCLQVVLESTKLKCLYISEKRIIKGWNSSMVSTHKRFKGVLFIRTKHNLQIFRAVPFMKLQKDI